MGHNFQFPTRQRAATPQLDAYADTVKTEREKDRALNYVPGYGNPSPANRTPGITPTEQWQGQFNPHLAPSAPLSLSAERPSIDPYAASPARQARIAALPRDGSNIQTPYGTISATTNWQQAVASAHPEIATAGHPANEAFVEAVKAHRLSTGADPDHETAMAMAKAASQQQSLSGATSPTAGTPMTNQALDVYKATYGGA